jgi:hypothetical protein
MLNLSIQNVVSLGASGGRRALQQRGTHEQAVSFVVVVFGNHTGTALLLDLSTQVRGPPLRTCVVRIACSSHRVGRMICAVRSWQSGSAASRVDLRNVGASRGLYNRYRASGLHRRTGEAPSEHGQRRRYPPLLVAWAVHTKISWRCGQAPNFTPGAEVDDGSCAWEAIRDNCIQGSSSISW